MSPSGLSRSFPVVPGWEGGEPGQILDKFAIATQSLIAVPLGRQRRRRRIVIYTRFSSDLQRQDSCADQEREVRASLVRMGIDTTDAIVIYDEAESGTKSDREKFEQIKAMVGQDEVSILAVDDQSRLSRADNVSGFVQELVFHGGRFISTGEGIDTIQKGWELRVKVMELHNSHTIRELGHRVRRGQEGRVRDDGSAGDYPYGYEAYYLDSNWQELLAKRGPKPKKGVRIFEEEAKWVQQIFLWFAVEMWSIMAIARELTRLGAPCVHGAKQGWTHQQVRRVLSNPKYIGEWRWGATTTIRNSTGQKKQVAVPDEQQVLRDRPQLRIIEQDQWNKAQARLRELKGAFGWKEGQKARGPKVHPSTIYPQSLLGGLIFCHACGARFCFRGNGQRAALGCPNHGKGTCSMATLVPIEPAEKALLGLLGDLVQGWPEWMQQTVTVMRNSIVQAASQVPVALEADRKRLSQVEREIGNLVGHLADGNFDSSAVKERLRRSETEAETLRNRIAGAEQALAAPISFPDDRWIQDQLTDLANLLKSYSVPKTAILLRKLLGKVTAHPVIAPGKVRGYGQLRFRLNGLELLKTLLGSRIPESVSAMVESLNSTVRLVASPCPG